MCLLQLDNPTESVLGLRRRAGDYEELLKFMNLFLWNLILLLLRIICSGLKAISVAIKAAYALI